MDKTNQPNYKPIRPNMVAIGTDVSAPAVRRIVDAQGRYTNLPLHARIAQCCRGGIIPLIEPVGQSTPPNAEA